MNGNAQDTRLIHAVLNARLIGFLKWGGLILLGLVAEAGVAHYQLAELRGAVAALQDKVTCLVLEKDADEEECLLL